MKKKNSQKPFILTIFGASGDLAKLKLFPALLALENHGDLPAEFYIIGYARSKKTEKEFREEFIESLKESKNGKSLSAKTAKKLAEHVFYFSGQYDSREDFVRYRAFVTEKTNGKNIPHLAYFSVPPFVFQPILENLGKTRKRKKEDLRIILEKPFGNDEKSAQKLFHFISRYFHYDQVYLLDHYLGKMGVQSILSLRHNNAILNMLLKGSEIATIQIHALENIGVAERVGYFESVGIIKDMFQSHLTQILAMITMSIPLTEKAESFQREKFAILSALKFSPKADNIFLGQYEGYKKLEGVSTKSKTETFMSVKLKIDRESWYGVPIFIRTGKRLKKKATYIVIEFRKMKFQKSLRPNRLILELQPNEQIHFKLINRYHEHEEYFDVAPAQSIACHGDNCLPEHALLLLDVLQKERLHFLSFPEILAAWKITDSILGFVERNNIPVEKYTDGITSPKGSARVFSKPGEDWYEI